MLTSRPMPSATRSAPRAPSSALSAQASHARGEANALLPWSWLAALAGLGLALDGVLAPRVLGEGDAAEFTLALALGGVPHPTGYPLYVLFGHGFVEALHALGCGWPRAANLWSAAGAAVATLLTAALADRLLPRAAGLGRPARLAIVAAALLALVANPVFLRAASQAEVHGWHLAWVAGSILAALTLARALGRGDPLSAAGMRAGACGWGLLTGAGLAHHLTAIFFLAPLGWMLARGARRALRLDPSVVLAFLAGAAVPLLSIGFVAWRAFHPAVFQWPALEPTWSGVLGHATGAAYRRYAGGFAPSAAEQQMLLRAVVPVVVPGFVAAILVAGRARREADPDAAPLLAMLAAAALQTAFTLGYGVPDPVAYFLPVMVVSVVAAARLGAGVAARLARPGPATGLALAAMALVALAWAWPEFDHARRIAQVDRELRAAFRALPFERGIVVWSSDSYARLRAYQLLDGEKPGLVVVNPGALTWPRERRAETRALGFDPLAGLRLESDADLALVAANIARQTALPVVDFADWWDRSQVSRPPAAHR